MVGILLPGWSPTLSGSLHPLQSGVASAATVLSFPVGSGITDSIPHQLVRTDDDRLYLFAAEGQFSKVLRAYWTPAAGLPNRSDDFVSTTVRDPREIVSVDVVYDGGSSIHVLVFNRTAPASELGEVHDYVFDTSLGAFKTPLLIASDLPTITGEYVGTSGISGGLDASGQLHLAYWSSGNHITHRAYRYNTAEHALTLTSEPTQVDFDGKSNHPAVAVSPLDDALTIAWVSEATSPARILARTRSSDGTWGAAETVSTAPLWISVNEGINIDQGPSLLIDSTGVKHVAYMEQFDNTGHYGRIHYATTRDTAWTSEALPYYTHVPTLALNSLGEVVILGHGHPNNPLPCHQMMDMCMYWRNGDGTWALPELVVAAPSGKSFDASPSVKWSAVHFNRSETIEFLFFLVNSTYADTTLYYGRIDPRVVPTATPTASATASATMTSTATATWTPTGTATASPTMTNTETPMPSATATTTPTATATMTATPSVTQTSTDTATPLSTLTATSTPTSTATARASATPTLVETNSPIGSELITLYLPLIVR